MYFEVNPDQKPLQSDKFRGHISLFLGVKMKDKLPALHPSFFFKFSQQRNINSFLKKEKIAKRNSSVIYNFYSLLLTVLRFVHFFFFLYFSRDHLRSRTICGSFWGPFGIWRSFTVQVNSLKEHARALLALFFSL